MVRKRSLFLTIGRVISVFIMGLVVAFIIALSQVNLETLRGDVLGILRTATGLNVEIDGAVSWKFSLQPRIQLNQVRVRNAEWAKDEYAFSAETIDVTLDLISLLQSRPTIKNVKIKDASISIEKNDAGEYSVMPKFADTADSDADANADSDAPRVMPKYPFVEPGLGGIEVKNLVANIFDETYSLSGFSIRYMPRDDAREYSGWIKPTDRVYPFIVSYAEYNEERHVYPMRIAVSTGGDALIANVALEATSLIPIDFVVSGDIPDVSAIGAAFDLGLTSVPMLHVNLAGGFDRNKITLRKSTVVVRGNTINFSGDYTWGRRRPVINAVLNSSRVSLPDLFPELYAGKKDSRRNRELNVFHDIPLFGREIRGADFSVRADIDKLVIYRDLVLTDMDLSARMVGGTGRVDLDTGFADGRIRIGADVDIYPDGVMDIVAAGRGKEIFVGTILNQIGAADLISDLPMNFEFYVRGAGADLSEIMGTITGPVRVYSAGSGYAHSALVSNIYGADFLTGLRHSIQDLFRSEKKHNQVKISCAAVSAKLRDGRIETENGVAVETNAINLRLAGNLDLGDETMKLALTTVPVRGLKLSLTGNVVNSIEITGNLATPDVKISAATVVGKVASATGIGLLLAPFTGGISIAAGAGLGLLAGDLLENWLADDTPCKTALERGAPNMRGDPEWMSEPMPELMATVLGDE